MCCWARRVRARVRKRECSRALWGIPQVASGDLLRAVVREDSELGREAASYMDRGQLVPDELVLKLIDERLDKKTLAKDSSSTDFRAT